MHGTSSEIQAFFKLISDTVSIRDSSSHLSIYFVPRLLILYCVLFLAERSVVSYLGFSSESIFMVT